MAALLGDSPVPMPGHPGHRRRNRRAGRRPQLAEALGGRVPDGVVDRIGSLAARPRPRSRSTCSSASSLTALKADTPAPPAREPGRRPTRRALYISSPIGLGHARRDQAIADELAGCTRPADRLAGAAPCHQVPRGQRRTHPPRLRRWPASRATLRASPPSTTCTASRPGGGWTRSSSPTSWSSTTWWLRSLRPVDRRRGLGARLLPAREPRAEDGRLCLADRLRRLAAHAGRRPREAALTADYNAEMIEHIARSPVSATGPIFIGAPMTLFPDPFGPGLPDPRLD